LISINQLITLKNPILYNIPTVFNHLHSIYFYIFCDIIWLLLLKIGVIMTKGTVKDFFMYLGLTLSLYIGLSVLIFLCFNYIDLYLTNNSDYRGYSLGSIRWGVSLLTVLFPLFLFLSYLINKDIKNDAVKLMKLEIRSRKWFLYSVMFVTSASVVMDLVYLLYGFLGGDLAKEFIFKSTAVLVIAGITFTYYFLELKRKVTVSVAAKVLGRLTSAGIVSVLVFGFYIVGSPITQRQHKQDEQRIFDLYTIRNAALDYYHTKGTLENDINLFGLNPQPKDPESKNPYEFRLLNTMPVSFELCANFKTQRKIDEASYAFIVWDYHPGRNCFTVQVEQTK